MVTIITARRASGRRGNADLCITNKRLICSYERTGLIFGVNASKSVYQMNIKDVGDISIAAVRKSWLAAYILFLIGIYIMIDGFAIGLSPSRIVTLVIGILFIAGGIVLLILGKSKGVKFNSKGGSGGLTGAGFYVIAKRRLTTGIAEFDEMACEIGALVADIQAYGDDCIPYWNSQNSQ